MTTGATGDTGADRIDRRNRRNRRHGRHRCDRRHRCHRCRLAVTWRHRCRRATRAATGATGGTGARPVRRAIPAATGCDRRHGCHRVLYSLAIPPARHGCDRRYRRDRRHRFDGCDRTHWLDRLRRGRQVHFQPAGTGVTGRYRVRPARRASTGATGEHGRATVLDQACDRIYRRYRCDRRHWPDRSDRSGNVRFSNCTGSYLLDGIAVVHRHGEPGLGTADRQCARYSR